MKLIITLFGLLGLLATPGEERKFVSWVIEPASSLSIHGASNVNEFTCGLSSYRYSDTLEVVERTPAFIRFSPNKLSLPIVDFDCRNKLITNDFQETLQSRKYPRIEISFLSFTLAPSRNSGVDSYDAEVMIELSGSSRKVTIRFDFWEKSYAQYKLTGKKVLSFSDFGLEPPTKVMGLVKVEDQLTIDFNLIVRPL